MGYEPRDVVDRDARAFEGRRARFDDGSNRAPEHFLALHLHVMTAGGDGLVRRGQATTAGRDLDEPGGGTVAAEIPGDQ